MSEWNAAHYLKFGDERTRPAADLAARIRLQGPARIVDVGCGPGNSTQTLRLRWPEADVLGIDSSPEMIAAARQSYPDGRWELADASTWTADQPFDVVFSNAALQWMGGHHALVRRLFAQVGPGGALAFQIPSAEYALIRRLIFDVSHDPRWDDRLQPPRTQLTMHPPAFYYDALVDLAAELDVWETEYQHVLASRAALIDWMSSTGLRPFLALLDGDAEQTAFLTELQRRVDAGYELRADGKVLFPFRRTFVIAYRAGE